KGRGSPPQVQCALGGVMNVPPIQGGVQADPLTGGLVGHEPPGFEPPLPVVGLPPAPATGEPDDVAVEPHDVEPPAHAGEASGRPESPASLPRHAAIASSTAAETKCLGCKIDSVIGSIVLLRVFSPQTVASETRQTSSCVTDAVAVRDAPDASRAEPPRKRST